MSIMTRRDFMKTTAALGVGMAVFESHPVLASPTRSYTTPEAIKRQAIDYFRAHSYARVAPVPLISGIEYNGGLNYDDRLPDSRLGQFTLQTCSRIEDIALSHIPSVLPIFTILTFTSQPNDQGDTPRTQLLLDYLIGIVGLTPARLRVTTTPLAAHLFPTFAQYGIGPSQIRIRDLAEAIKAGDGSGYFAPVGHPGHPALPTYSVEYILSANHKRRTPAMEIELAEMGLGELPNFSAGGFGIERVTMAKNDEARRWKDDLPTFNRRVRSLAQRMGVPLPSGYYKILGLP
ncbi:MAG: twin-arginine translocation signal domain-containing protein [Methylococcaceae bacterium]|jgi:hypothetical protein